MTKKLLTILFFLLSDFCAFAAEVPITIFPLDNYNQDINYWVKPTDPDYDKPLISADTQKSRVEEYYNHYFATDAKGLSPWSEIHVTRILNEELNSIASQQKILAKYSNSPTYKTDLKKIGYGSNFRPHAEKWLQKIITNINLQQFASIKYNPNNRAIATKNLLARFIPTNDPYFYKFTLPGEGYPFDNIQESVLWAGTPVYIVGETLDKQWYLVISPHFMLWIQSDGVARTDESFIEQWTKFAKQKIIAITRTDVGIIDTKNHFRFNSHVGMVFPGIKTDDPKKITFLIPIVNTRQKARIAFAKLNKDDASVIPIVATPHNFATIISRQIGRPYGWGSMNFYNDCSSELLSFFTPFGIWLPRHSANQLKAGKVIDKSMLTKEERLNYLIKNGEKFTTLIFYKGHVMLYIGAYPNSNSPEHELIAMTYQNKWPLWPKDKSYRAIIGGSVLLPLLLTYPEDPNLNSLANESMFKLIYLNQPQGDCTEKFFPTLESYG